MVKRNILGLLITGGLMLTGTGFVGVANADATIDTRKTVVFTLEERAAYLQYMREILVALQSMTQNLGTENMSAVANAARGLAKPMKEVISLDTMRKLPEEFALLLSSVPIDFEHLAAEADSVKDPQNTLAQLSTIMAKCLACHQVYQVQTK